MIRMSGIAVVNEAAAGVPAYTVGEVASADFFQVLSSPIRLAVLRLLMDGGRTVGDLMAELSIAQSRLSNHLACLRTCGLVTTRREGTFVYYAIADPRIREILTLGEHLAISKVEELSHCVVLQSER
jgi:DNA-binding transcriptional ArsR family regulator